MERSRTRDHTPKRSTNRSNVEFRRNLFINRMVSMKKLLLYIVSSIVEINLSKGGKIFEAEEAVRLDEDKWEKVFMEHILGLEGWIE